MTSLDSLRQMLAAATLAPWYVGETVRDGSPAVIGDGDSVVCEFPDRLGATVDADAALIALAPELAEALADTLAFLRETEGDNFGADALEMRLAELLARVGVAS